MQVINYSIVLKYYHSCSEHCTIVLDCKNVMCDRCKYRTLESIDIARTAYCSTTIDGKDNNITNIILVDILARDI